MSHLFTLGQMDQPSKQDPCRKGEQRHINLLHGPTSSAHVFKQQERERYSSFRYQSLCLISSVLSLSVTLSLLHTHRQNQTHRQTHTHRGNLVYKTGEKKKQKKHTPHTHAHRNRNTLQSRICLQPKGLTASSS